MVVLVASVVLLTAVFVFFAFNTPALAAAAGTDDDEDDDDKEDKDDRSALVVGGGSIGEGSEASESKDDGRTKDVNWGWLRITEMGRRNNGMRESGLSAS